MWFIIIKTHDPITLAVHSLTHKSFFNPGVEKMAIDTSDSDVNVSSEIIVEWVPLILFLQAVCLWRSLNQLPASSEGSPLHLHLQRHIFSRSTFKFPLCPSNLSILLHISECPSSWHVQTVSVRPLWLCLQNSVPLDSSFLHLYILVTATLPVFLNHSTSLISPLFSMPLLFAREWILEHSYLIN